MAGLQYMSGVAAERELNWNDAVEKYKKCDADTDFIDPVCLISAIRAELRQMNYSAAKTTWTNVRYLSLSEEPRPFSLGGAYLSIFL